MAFTDIPEGLTAAEDGEVVTLSFSRPQKLNPLNEDILEGVIHICAALRDRHDIRVVIVRGEGRAFSAGMDIGGMAARRGSGAGPPTVEQRLRGGKTGQRACEALERLDQVTVASLHGYVVGGGMALALACDFRIAMEDLEMWLPEVDIGVPMTWGTVPRLIALVGPSRAKEIIMTCERIDAETALAWGLVNRVTKKDEALPDATQSFVDMILSKPPVAVAMTKHMVTAAARTWAHEAAYADPYLLLMSSQTSDAVEALAARAQKRDPEFKGR